MVCAHGLSHLSKRRTALSPDGGGGAAAAAPADKDDEPPAALAACRFRRRAISSSSSPRTLALGWPLAADARRVPCAASSAPDASWPRRTRRSTTASVLAACEAAMAASSGAERVTTSACSIGERANERHTARSETS
eukprot:3626656-Prymnesium_polylepis.1